MCFYVWDFDYSGQDAWRAATVTINFEASVSVYFFKGSLLLSLWRKYRRKRVFSRHFKCIIMIQKKKKPSAVYWFPVLALIVLSFIASFLLSKWQDLVPSKTGPVLLNVSKIIHPDITFWLYFFPNKKLYSIQTLSSGFVHFLAKHGLC